MTKCAICGDEIQGKGKKLGDGNVICKDCYDSTALIVTCEICENEVLATSALKDEGGYRCCKKCFIKGIEEEHEWPSWEDWKEWCVNDGDPIVFEEWVTRVKEDVEEQWTTRIGRKTAMEIAMKEVEEARKTVKKAA
jgi:hypothetical protein